MMKRLALVSLVVLSACTRATKETTSPADIGVLAPKDSEPRKTLVAMLNWHRENDSTLNRLQGDIVVFQVQGSDSTLSTRDGYKLYETDSALHNRLYYRVSKKHLDRYLSYLKSSEYFSDNFLNKWRKHAEKSDSLLVQNPANDGPPRGFEFEWITSSQEWEIITAKPDTISWYQISSSDSTIQLSWPNFGWSYILVRKGNRWYIESHAFL